MHSSVPISLCIVLDYCNLNLTIMMTSGSHVEGRSTKHGKNAKAGRCGYDVPKKCCLKTSRNRYVIILIVNTYAS